MVRHLYLVPMIHTNADMGSAAAMLDQAGSAKLTPAVWQTHQGIVAAFWKAIAGFSVGLDARVLKVYQDGLVAGGEEGIKIVREGAAQGSWNYQIIAMLIEKGAGPVQTESLPLIKQEYGYINKITHAATAKGREAAVLRYRLARKGLLQSRDEFIARRIGETLGEDETGILFIGAYHHVAVRLAPDISVAQVKDRGMVREYHHLLLNTQRDARRFRALGEYLAASVTEVSFGDRTAVTPGRE